MDNSVIEFFAQYGTFEDVIDFSEYMVSDLGLVMRKEVCMFLTPITLKDGHEHVRIKYDFGKKQWYPLRLLVAKAFVRPLPETREELVPNEYGCNDVEHINGDKTNNEASNLRWV